MCDSVGLGDYTVVMPTRNAGHRFDELCGQILSQKVPPYEVIILDSSSQDGTRATALNSGFRVIDIDPANFDHGGTRNVGLFEVRTEFVFFLTHDVLVPSRDAFSSLLSSFIDPSIGAAYGRQLAHSDADIMSRLTREFSYPPESYIAELGRGTSQSVDFSITLFSNAFSAFRVRALRDIGGFENRIILGEDVEAISRLLFRGWKISYSADSCVNHSHNYTLLEDCRRSFDIGVFHANSIWIIEKFGEPSGRGFRLLAYLVTTLLRIGRYDLALVSVIRSVARFIAYRIGRKHDIIGIRCARFLSMHKRFFS